MKSRILILSLALGTALLLPAAAQAQYGSNWRAPTFPWMKRYPMGGANNAAAQNGDAAIRWQETINAYAHK